MPFQFRKEAIEEDLNSNFPSQGQGNPPLYYSLSEVVVPTYSINTVTEGSALSENLQTAWDFSTGSAQIVNTTSTVISNTGFWKVGVSFATQDNTPSVRNSRLELFDGITAKPIWAESVSTTNQNDFGIIAAVEFVVFLRSGDILRGVSPSTADIIDVWYRQIANVNGILVNPLGFSFA